MDKKAKLVNFLDLGAAAAALGLMYQAVQFGAGEGPSISAFPDDLLWFMRAAGGWVYLASFFMIAASSADRFLEAWDRICAFKIAQHGDRSK